MTWPATRANAASQWSRPTAICSSSSATIALGVLRAPAKVAQVHHTVGDESVSRAVLAWSASAPDSIVGLAGTADPRRITFWSQASMTESLRKILAADASLRDDEIGCKVSTTAAVVFLAVLDHLRSARLYSMVVHSVPETTFSQAEVMERLKDAASEDFRWPLLFAEKVIPGRLVTSLTPPEVDAALRELAAAKLIEAAAPGRYEPTDVGRVIADGVLHDVSKVVISIADVRPDGQLGCDVVLLVRSSFHLFLFMLAGQTAAIAAVSDDELAAVLHLALRPAQPPAAAVEPAAQPAAESPPPPPPVAEKQWYFSRGGQSEGPIAESALRALLASLPPDTLVWNQEMPGWAPASAAGLVPRGLECPDCHAQLEPGKRFCGRCGTPMM